MRRHLAGCSPCLRHARETAALVRTLRSLPRNKAPGGVLEGVVSRLTVRKIQAQKLQAQAGRQPRSRPKRPAFTSPRVSFWAACTAAFLLGVTATVTFTGSFSDSPSGRRDPGEGSGSIDSSREALQELQTRSTPSMPPGISPGEPRPGPLLENFGNGDFSLVANPGDPESEARPHPLGSSALEKLPGPATGR